VPEDFDVRTVPGLLTERGDPHADPDGGIDGAVCDITTALEWYDRSGLGDLPYPPEYPKMAGEPMRVQPSRARHPSS
jgi:hypothetical protein